MSTSFDDLKIIEPGRSNPSALEVILFEGVRPDTSASTVPCFFRMDKTSFKPGITLVGYTHLKDEKYIAMTPDRLDQSSTVIGGWHIYKNAIYSIRELSE